MPRGRSGRRADYDWQGQVTSEEGIDLAIGTLAIGDNRVVDFGAAGTVMRIHGSVLFTLDAGAIAERVTLAYGIIKTSAVQNVASEVPRPFTDIEDNWVLHGFTHLTSSSGAAIDENWSSALIQVDSKAMRKVKATESLTFVVEVADSVDQTGTFDFAAAFRVLLAS